jgi:hypothetical protein
LLEFRDEFYEKYGYTKELGEMKWI